MRLSLPKLLKTHVEKMSTFRLSRMFMKTKELNQSFQDVNENKGERRLTRFRGKPEVCGSTGHPGDGAVLLSRAPAALLTIEPCTMHA